MRGGTAAQEPLEERKMGKIRKTEKKTKKIFK